jgi:hypothetical protein
MSEGDQEGWGAIEFQLINFSHSHAQRLAARCRRADYVEQYASSAAVTYIPQALLELFSSMRMERDLTLSLSRLCKTAKGQCAAASTHGELSMCAEMLLTSARTLHCLRAGFTATVAYFESTRLLSN